MLDFGFYNMDCMDGMKEFPDNYFDLAIVDPPYGINIGNSSKKKKAKNIKIGGVLQRLKFIKHLMIVLFQINLILRNYKECVKKGLFGVVTTF